MKADQEVRFAVIKNGYKMTEIDMKEFTYGDSVRRKRVAEILLMVGWNIKKSLKIGIISPLNNYGERFSVNSYVMWVFLF